MTKRPVEVVHLLRRLGLGGCETTLASWLSAGNAPDQHRIVYFDDTADRHKRLQSHPHVMRIVGTHLRRRALLRRELKREEAVFVVWFFPAAALYVPIGARAIVHLATSASWLSKRARVYMVIAMLYLRVFCHVVYVAPSRHIITSIPFGKLLLGDSVIVPNGVASVDTPAPTLSEQERVRITMIGRLDESKDFRAFIRIIAAADVRIGATIVGDGPDRDALTTYAREHQVDVDFMGYVQNVNSILDETDVFLFCSYPGEGFGNVLVEALSRGCIVLAPNYGANPEILAGTQNPLYNTETEAVNRLRHLRTLTKRQKYGIRTSNHAMSVARFSNLRTAVAYDELVARIESDN